MPVRGRVGDQALEVRDVAVDRARIQCDRFATGVERRGVGAAQRRLNSRRDAGKKESATTILTVRRGALRRIGRLSHYSGSRHTAAAR